MTMQKASSDYICIVTLCADGRPCCVYTSHCRQVGCGRACLDLGVFMHCHLLNCIVTFRSTMWPCLDMCIDVVGRWDVAEPGLTWERLMQNKNKELDRLNGVYMKLLNNAGVKYIEGRGSLVDAHTVEVGGKQYTVSILAMFCIILHYLLWGLGWGCWQCPVDGYTDISIPIADYHWESTYRRCLACEPARNHNNSMVLVSTSLHDLPWCHVVLDACSNTQSTQCNLDMCCNCEWSAKL